MLAVLKSSHQGITAAHNSRISNLSILGGDTLATKAGREREGATLGSRRLFAWGKGHEKKDTRKEEAGEPGGDKNNTLGATNPFPRPPPPLLFSCSCFSSRVVLRYPGVWIFSSRFPFLGIPFSLPVSSSAVRSLFILLSLDRHQLLTSAKQRSFGTYLPRAAYFTISRKLRGPIVKIGESSGQGN